MSKYQYSLIVPIKPTYAMFNVERDDGELTLVELLKSIDVDELANVWAFTQGHFSGAIFSLVHRSILENPEKCDIEKIEVTQ